MSKDTLFTLYICLYEFTETPFSRHYTSGISTCRKLGRMEMSKLEEILTHDQLNALQVHGETIIVDISTIENILLRMGMPREDIEKLLEAPYIYILIKMEK